MTYPFRHARAVAIAMCILAAGCEDPQPTKHSDAATSNSDATGCDPGCHWDCFFHHAICSQGKVYFTERGAVPCCKNSDPWPGPGPGCSDGRIYHVCKSGCVKYLDLDKRYRHCLRPETSFYRIPSTGYHFLDLLCQETTFKKVGAPCKSGDDCRPAAASLTRLTCDNSTHACVLTKRKPAPAIFGSSCGLDSSDVKPGMNFDFAGPGKTCALCHHVWDETAKCMRQACTLSCNYDEDCPDGSVCLCVGTNKADMAQICAPATERNTVEGRSAWLKCPGNVGSDAGASDSSPSSDATTSDL